PNRDRAKAGSGRFDDAHRRPVECWTLLGVAHETGASPRTRSVFGGRFGVGASGGFQASTGRFLGAGGGRKSFSSWPLDLGTHVVVEIRHIRHFWNAGNRLNSAFKRRFWSDGPCLLVASSPSFRLSTRSRDGV